MTSLWSCQGWPGWTAKPCCVSSENVSGAYNLATAQHSAPDLKQPFTWFTVDTTNGTSEFESGDYVSTVTRVMVSQNRLWSDSEEVVALQVFSEVIEMEGKKVKLVDWEKDNRIFM